MEWFGDIVRNVVRSCIKRAWIILVISLCFCFLVFFFFFWRGSQEAYRIFISLQEIETAPWAEEVPGPNHWNTREFPSHCFCLSDANNSRGHLVSRFLKYSFKK